MNVALGVSTGSRFILWLRAGQTFARVLALVIAEESNECRDLWLQCCRTSRKRVWRRADVPTDGYRVYIGPRARVSTNDQAQISLIHFQRGVYMSLIEGAESSSHFISRLMKAPVNTDCGRQMSPRSSDHTVGEQGMQAPCPGRATSTLRRGSVLCFFDCSPAVPCGFEFGAEVMP